MKFQDYTLQDIQPAGISPKMCMNSSYPEAAPFILYFTELQKQFRTHSVAGFVSLFTRKRSEHSIHCSAKTTYMPTMGRKDAAQLQMKRLSMQRGLKRHTLIVQSTTWNSKHIFQGHVEHTCVLLCGMQTIQHWEAATNIAFQWTPITLSPVWFCCSDVCKFGGNSG